MSRVLKFAVGGLAVSLAIVSSARGQATPYIGYVYPAGGQQGTTFQVKLGGQRLDGVQGAVVTGEGVSAKLVEYHRNMSNQEMALLREQLKELKRPPVGKRDQATLELVARLGKIVAEYVNRPASVSIANIAIVEVAIAPGAEPGARELRLVTERGVSNPLVFEVGQLPEFSREPMRTSSVQVLGKEALALRKRPAEEEEQRVTLPCTMNGQIASGEVNRYRFEAQKGQRLVIPVHARQLIPYVADAVPGWFQPVLTLHDANGNEVAFNDDYRFKPDPTLFYEVPKDGEYVLEITDAIYRGREDFVYRITIGEVPLVTSIFPLGGRVGEPNTITMDGWNLEKARLVPPPKDAGPGIYQIVARNDGRVSNSVPFAIDTLPEGFDEESNNDPSHAQEVKLPLIVNGRVDRPDDWDVFQFQGRAGQKIVVEVVARRLESPLDSLIKITDSAGNLLGLNDDHRDVGSGVNTHHADSYLAVQLPADGTCYVHLGDTARHGGKEYAYRLRISAPQPEFALRIVPSSLALRGKVPAAISVHAIRKDGFEGDITLALKDPPAGFLSSSVTLPEGKDMVKLPVKARRSAKGEPVSLVIEGRATIGDRDVVREAVPAEDRMQAFLWRHFVPAKELAALACMPSRDPPSKRVPPPSVATTEVPAASTGSAEKPKFTKRQVGGRLRQLRLLYEEWLLTDEFYARKVAECQADL